MSRTAILLPFKDGVRFLPAQLESLSRQEMTDWELLAGDDGSQDESAALVREHFEGRKQRVALFEGPCQGVSANLFSLLERVQRDVAFVAYCDQDDVWAASKLAVGRRVLERIPAQVPALYCGRTRLVDARGQAIGLSPLHRRVPSFRNAVVQNVASGNTMMVNRAALRLLQWCIPLAQDIVHHDWWTYQLITGVGGTVIYDPSPRVDYRQHDSNAIGVGSRLHRIRRAVSGGHSADVTAHLNALDACRDHLTNGNRDLLDRFMASRTGGAYGRVHGVVGTGIHRLRPSESISLWATAAMGRL